MAENYNSEEEKAKRILEHDFLQSNEWIENEKVNWKQKQGLGFKYRCYFVLLPTLHRWTNKQLH